jgi:hypothetical protein
MKANLVTTGSLFARIAPTLLARTIAEWGRLATGEPADTKKPLMYPPWFGL